MAAPSVLSVVDGLVALPSSASQSQGTAPATGNAGTIATQGLGVSRVNPAAAITGVIMQAGTFPGQICWVVNEAVAANTITMAASGTSNVAEGVSCVIAGVKSRALVWDSVTSLWYAG